MGFPLFPSARGVGQETAVKFKHQPLALVQTQIRLLYIDPRPPEDGIHCSIATFNLDANTTPRFRALSYTWGPKSSMRTIFLNDQAFEIRENLYNFLHLCASNALPFLGQHFWIDQISIDQTNIQERNHQVHMMSQIFRAATEVISWLGKRADNSDIAMDHFTASENFELRSHAPDDSTASKTEKMPSALRHVFQRPYWSRLWVVQEILLARTWRIACGRKLVDEQSFLASISNPQWADIVSPAIWTTSRGRDTQSSRLRNLHLVLRTLAHLDCEDPRDKIFGLQALVKSRNRVPIDYSRTSGELFWEAVARFQTMEKQEDARRAIIALGQNLGVTGLERNFNGLARDHWFDGISDQHPSHVFTR